MNSLKWFNLTLSWRRLLSYRNQTIDLFLYDNGLRQERVKSKEKDNLDIVPQIKTFSELASEKLEQCVDFTQY